MRCFLVVVLRGEGESGVPGIVWKVGFQDTLRLIGWSGGVRGAVMCCGSSAGKMLSIQR